MYTVDFYRVNKAKNGNEKSTKCRARRSHRPESTTEGVHAGDYVYRLANLPAGRENLLSKKDGNGRKASAAGVGAVGSIVVESSLCRGPDAIASEKLDEFGG